MKVWGCEGGMGWGYVEGWSGKRVDARHVIAPALHYPSLIAAVHLKRTLPNRSNRDYVHCICMHACMDVGTDVYVYMLYMYVSVYVCVYIHIGYICVCNMYV